MSDKRVSEMTEDEIRELAGATCRRISLELSHSWPGEMYLRFETGAGPAVMVGVTEADLDGLRRLLGCSHESADREAGFGLPYDPAAPFHDRGPVP